MNRHLPCLITFTFALCCALPVSAQETCTEEDTAALEACITTCEAAAPECEKQPLTLEELRTSIAEECDCESAKNYGKYRSCVAQLLNAAKKFSLITQEDLLTVKKVDNKECRAQIKENKKNNKNKGKENGKGKGKGKNKGGDDDSNSEETAE